MSKILVTGGAGCIGSHLVEKLCALGHDVTILDSMMRGNESFRHVKEITETCKLLGVPNPEIVIGDVTDFSKLKQVFTKLFDVVYHLAALPSHRLALEKPHEYAMVDVMGTINVLEASRLSNNPTVVFASSNKVYGKTPPPFREDSEPAPEGPYGQAKLSAEKWCYQYSKYYGINTPIVRYHHVLGPRTQPDRELSIFTERIIKNQNPIIHGVFEGNNFVSCAADYTDVNDAVEGTIRAAKINGFNVFNLATGKVTLVEDVAKIIMKHLGKNLPLEKKQMLSHETLVHLSDISKAKNVLNFEAKTPVDHSIKNYVEWRLKIGPRTNVEYR